MRLRRVFWALGIAVILWLVFGQDVEGQPLPDSTAEKVGQFAARYPNEVVFCWGPEGLHLPPTSAAGRMRVSADCPPETRVHIHTHPRALLSHDGLKATYWRLEFYRKRGHDPAGPRDLCYLSDMDVQTLLRQPFKWAMVVVTPTVYCWWERDDLLHSHPIQRYNDPPEGQVSWPHD